VHIGRKIKDTCDFILCAYHCLGGLAIVEPLVLAVLRCLKCIVHIETVYVEATTSHKIAYPHKKTQTSEEAWGLTVNPAKDVTYSIAYKCPLFKGRL